MKSNRVQCVDQHVLINALLLKEIPAVEYRRRERNELQSLSITYFLYRSRTIFFTPLNMAVSNL